MIKNDKQYAITKAKFNEFRKSLELINDSENNDLLKKIMSDSIKSQIETFNRELNEYENLKHDRPTIIDSTIENLPEALIKIRIIQGLSQKELAQRLGWQEQQIQRYEATNYESANFERIVMIAKSMNIHLGNVRLVLPTEELNVDGYDPDFIRQATFKLKARKTLLAIAS